MYEPLGKNTLGQVAQGSWAWKLYKHISKVLDTRYNGDLKKPITIAFKISYLNKIKQTPSDYSVVVQCHIKGNYSAANSNTT